MGSNVPLATEDSGPAALLNQGSNPSPAQGPDSVHLSCSSNPDAVSRCGLGPQANSAGGTQGAGWLNISARVGTPPTPRSFGRSIAYDPRDGYVVMFGGDAPTGGYLSDTWAFSNGSWKELTTNASPPARDHSTLAWDPVDQYLVLFGGSGSVVYNDTWAFARGEWTQLHPPAAPSPRWSAGMVWDARDGTILLFGGCAAGSEQNDTWSFLHGNWTELSPTTSPSPRGDSGMAYDAVDSQVVLFGGLSANWGALDNDTWAYSAGTWTEISSPGSPPARYDPSMAFDTAIGQVVLFGGEGALASLGDTWGYANNRWVGLSESNVPASRSFGMLVYDPDLDGLLLYGGATVGSGTSTETWEFYTLNLTARVSSPSEVAPESLDATANSTGGVNPIAYLWRFGDGGSSNLSSATHAYLEPGTYQATITSSDYFGVTSERSFTVIVLPLLVVRAGITPSFGSVPLAVSYYAVASGGIPPYQYNWTLGIDSWSNASNGNVTYPSAGDTIVTLSVRDSGGQALQKEFVLVALAPTPTNLSVSILASRSTCDVPCALTFTATVGGGVGPETYAWGFGDGAGSSAPAPSHQFLSAGNYTVALEVHDSATGVGLSNVSISVNPSLTVIPHASVLVGPTPLLVTFTSNVGGGAGPYRVAWTFGDSSSLESSGSQHTYTFPGTYTVRLSAVDSTGTEANGTLEIVALPTATSVGEAGMGGSLLTLAIPVSIAIAGGEVALGLLLSKVPKKPMGASAAQPGQAPRQGDSSSRRE
ncbi:MAG TPA: PKD domain-containing protein [Thermoplasmata archaeon]|nr:PKD domain-containing protein [Thermoplasmata archaeon]